MTAHDLSAFLARSASDPALLRITAALTAGKALTVAELAAETRLERGTVAACLDRLAAAGIVRALRQGPHRYHGLADGLDPAAVAGAIGTRPPALGIRTGPRDGALRAARVCYGHLAGPHAVALMDGLVARRCLVVDADEPVLTPEGYRVLRAFGIDPDALRPPLCRACLDWSERCPHLGGRLGVALMDRFLALGWVRREAGRLVTVTATGVAGLAGLARPAS